MYLLISGYLLYGYVVHTWFLLSMHLLFTWCVSGTVWYLLGAYSVLLDTYIFGQYLLEIKNADRYLTCIHPVSIKVCTWYKDKLINILLPGL